MSGESEPKIKATARRVLDRLHLSPGQNPTLSQFVTKKILSGELESEHGPLSIEDKTDLMQDVEKIEATWHSQVEPESNVIDVRTHEVVSAAKLGAAVVTAYLEAKVVPDLPLN